MFPLNFKKRNKNDSRSSLSFSELRIKEKKSLKNKVRPYILFLKYIPVYIQKKQVKTVNFLYSSLQKFISLVFKLKSNFTIKLIWGRGKLGRPLVHVSILLLAGIVFLAGGVFQKELIVLSKEEREVFIASRSDIVPQPVLVSVSSPNSTLRDTVTTYTVKSGDTLSSIGKQFNVTVDTLRYANDITSVGYLRVGQEVEIPPVNGVIYAVKEGDTINSLAKEFEVSEQAIADFNYLSKPFKLSKGQQLVLPDAEIPSPVVANRPQSIQSTGSDTYAGSAYTFIPYAPDGQSGSGAFVWPTNSRYITQYFSFYHPAVDIAKVSPIYASDHGVVIRSGWWTNGYGFAVQIDHRNGYVTTYAHMSRLDVSVGDEVGQGQSIGMMGSTGRSTGPHVHFTIQQNGQYVNPLSFF